MIYAMCVNDDDQSEPKLEFGKTYLIVPKNDKFASSICDVYTPGGKLIPCNGQYGVSWLSRRFKPIHISGSVIGV